MIVCNCNYFKLISEPKKRQLWLKVWFNKLEKAESENSDFFELLEEDELEFHNHALNNCDIIKEPDVPDDVSDRRYQKDHQETPETLTSNDISSDNVEEKDPAFILIQNDPPATANWITFEDTYKMKQRKWSQDSSSSSVSSFESSSSMSTTSNESSL